MSEQFFIELHKIRACWPTKLIYGIQLSEIMSQKNLIISKYKDILKNPVTLDLDLLDFIFYLVDNQNLSLETAEASVIILNYYLKNSKNPNKYNIQLLIMVSVFICSKMFDVRRFSLGHFHQISEHKYNNKMVMKCEADILKTLNYDLFIRDCTINNKVGLYLETIRDYFENKDFLILKETTEEFIKLLYEDMKLIKNLDIDFLSVSIIQAAFMMCSMEEGKTPLLLKLALLSQFKEEDICIASKKIIKNVLGNEIYKMFNF
jgi:hypothetical protein